MAANIEITNAYFIDPYGNPLTTLVVGEQPFLRAEWKTMDLTSQDQYSVRLTVDGVSLPSTNFFGSPGVDVPQSIVRLGFFASPGPHTFTVTLDVNNTVSEANESDNTLSINYTPIAPDTLPVKLVTPLAGVPFQDWVIVNYVDVNPTGGSADFTGGPFAYNTHNGIDYTLADFAHMDSGVPVYAAAPGVVTRALDGYYDRYTQGSSTPPNFVFIDHGNGWMTQYLHLAMNTVAVKVGDTVEAGQIIGLVGSSGRSSGAHLHFIVVHNSMTVETNFAPSAYWKSPLPYQGSLPPLSLGHGITNYPRFEDWWERGSGIDQFPPSYAGKVFLFHSLQNVHTGDVLTVSWYRPDGALEDTTSLNVPFTIPFSGTYWELTRTWSLPEYQGTWNVVVDVDGLEMFHTTFDITPVTVPEIRVAQGTTYILDERTTPIAFGSVALGDAAPQKTFVIQNHGFAPLTLNNPTIPPGFSLVGSFPTSVDPGGKASFTVQLDTSRAGVKFGQIRVDTNDADESTFGFNVSGIVAGPDPAGAPRITLPGPAFATINGAPAKLLDPGATLIDSDSPHFDVGSLTVEFASGGSVDDQFGVRNEGNGAGQIGVAGNVVSFGGLPIGTFTGGLNLVPLVIALNDQATSEAVNALLRNLTFRNVASVPYTAPRYVRFTVVDETGKESNQPVKTVLVGPTLEAEPPLPLPPSPRQNLADSAPRSEDITLEPSNRGPVSMFVKDEGTTTVNVTIRKPLRAPWLPRVFTLDLDLDTPVG